MRSEVPSDSIANTASRQEKIIKARRKEVRNSAMRGNGSPDDCRTRKSVAVCSYGLANSMNAVKSNRSAATDEYGGPDSRKSYAVPRLSGQSYSVAEVADGTADDSSTSLRSIRHTMRASTASTCSPARVSPKEQFEATVLRHLARLESTLGILSDGILKELHDIQERYLSWLNGHSLAACGDRGGGKAAVFQQSHAGPLAGFDAISLGDVHPKLSKAALKSKADGGKHAHFDAGDEDAHVEGDSPRGERERNGIARIHQSLQHAGGGDARLSDLRQCLHPPSGDVLPP
eukprot:TRINITY_DN31106_c0_g1_i1.p1 TRINITY_DN31106_c0_g1~~TRINITY_DN31106_c0_g1_i1.p1  ORF type:complete len:312 (+),score=28.66 TRINITY_DN31106_c0_g1_i1:72-938(+)